MWRDLNWRLGIGDWGIGDLLDNDASKWHVANSFLLLERSRRQCSTSLSLLAGRRFIIQLLTWNHADFPHLSFANYMCDRLTLALALALGLGTCTVPCITRFQVNSLELTVQHHQPRETRLQRLPSSDVHEAGLTRV